MIRVVARALALLLPVGLMMAGSWPQAHAASASGSWACALGDPSAGCSNLLPPMPTVRQKLSAVTGKDGRVYALGGDIGNTGSDPVATVEAYNPRARTWTTAPSLPTARENMGAVEGPNGLIYTFGGYSSTASQTVSGSLVEAYNSTTKTWACSQGDPATSGCSSTTIQSMPVGRSCPGVTVGQDGKIYVIGGIGVGQFTSEADVYDPVANTWSTIAPMPDLPIACSGAVTGSDGRIYVIGQVYQPNSYPNYPTVMDIYTPSTNSWTRSPLPDNRIDTAVALGSDGNIYVIGGEPTPSGTALSTVDEYVMSTGTWMQAPAMSHERAFLAATAGPGGRIYVLGGWYTGSPEGVLETYSPSAHQWNDYATNYTYDNNVAVAAGVAYAFDGYQMQTYSSATNTWGPLSNVVGDYGYDDITVAGGKIYLFGSGGFTRYNPMTKTWTCSVGDTTSGCTSTNSKLAPAPTSGEPSAAIAAPNGLIYAFLWTSLPQGTDGPGVVEAYNPSTNTWLCSKGDPATRCTAQNSTLSPMPTERGAMGVAVGPDGLIYTVGGLPNSGGYSNDVEAYNPTTNVWTCSVGDSAAGCTSSTLPSLPTPRSDLALVTSGSALYSLGGGDFLQIVEAFNPTTGTWTCSIGDTAPGCSASTLQPIPAGRHGFTGTTWRNGQIVVLGGTDSTTNEFEVYTPPS